MPQQFTPEECKSIGLYVLTHWSGPLHFAESSDSSKITDPQQLLELRDVLQTQYQDGITAIPQAQLNSDDSFSGIFEDEVSSKLIKRFKFAISPNNIISYKLLNPADVGNFTEELEFAAAGTKTKKKKNCTKGVSCGIGCISATKTCRKASDAGTKKKTDNLRKKVKTGTKTNSDSSKATTTKKADVVTKTGGIREQIADLKKQYQQQIRPLEDEYNAAKAVITDKFSKGKSPNRAEQKRRDNAQLNLRKKNEEYIQKRNELVAQELKKTYKDPQPQMHHGMSKSEDMWSVEHEGIRYHGAGDFKGDHVLVKMISRDLDENDPLPKSLTRHTSDVYFSSQRNKHDAYWEEKYKIPNFQSGATGGDRSVVYYNGGGSDRGTLVHEMGHNLATGRYGTTAPPESSSYVQAVTKDGDHPSDYGRKSRAEDFAESARMYYEAPELLEVRSPNRYKVMKQILEDENFAG